MTMTLSDRISESLEPIVRGFKALDRFLILTHSNPDGDALGSILALGLGLKALGKKVVMYCEGGVPDTFSFLPGGSFISESPGEPEDYDAVVLVDCHELDRVGPAVRKMGRASRLIVLDHHLVNVELPEWSVVDTSLAAAGELVFYLLQKLEAAITPDMASNMYMAIATDTGHFSYDNTTPDCLDVASRLVASGAQPWAIYRQLYMGRSSARLKLLGRALCGLEFFYDGRVGAITVTNRMMEETGTGSIDTDGFVEYPRSVKGVDLAMLFREGENGSCKVSLRSLGNVNAAALAQEFGGGGHYQAAGFSCDGKLDVMKPRVIDAVGAYLTVEGNGGSVGRP